MIPFMQSAGVKPALFVLMQIAHGIWIRLAPNQVPMKKHAIPMIAPAARRRTEINWSTGRA